MAKKDNSLSEELSSLEHEQWISWAKSLLKSEAGISKERASRWKKLFVPYSELSEESKEQDREYAGKVLAVLKDGMEANKYLEKIAGALQSAIRKGLVTAKSGISSEAIAAAGKKGLAAKGSSLGASALNKSMTGPTAFSKINTATQKTNFFGSKKTIMPISSASSAAAGGSTDSLAKSTIQGRLASKQKAIAGGRVPDAKPTKNAFGGDIKKPVAASAPAGAAPAGGSLLSKAKSFIHTNPKTSMGLGAAAVGTAGYVAGKSNSNQGY